MEVSAQPRASRAQPTDRADDVRRWERPQPRQGGRGPREQGGRAASPGRRRSRPRGVAWRRPWRRSVAVNSSFPVTIYSRIAWLPGAAAGGRSAVPLPLRPEGSARWPKSRLAPLQVSTVTPGPEEGWGKDKGALRRPLASCPSRGRLCDPGCPLQWSRSLGEPGGAAHSRAPCPSKARFSWPRSRA